MTMRFLPMAMAAMLVSGSLAGQSNEQGALAQMRRFPAYQQAILRVYQGYERGLSTHCPKLDLDVTTARAALHGPLRLDAEGHIVNGGWTERTDGIACGEKRRYAAFVVFKDGTPAVYPLLPGDSYASPVLQRDATLVVLAGVKAMSASCPPEVLDTALPDGATKREGMPWNEKWTVRSCEKLYLVLMHFVPDQTGTGINVNAAETVELPGKAPRLSHPP
jgi:hypothetical protein